MYEFDLKFPYESQLVIGVKDWESIVGKKSRLIGKTTIDLEDRFYSNSYAVCGLARKFELDGYNRWRDILTPTQILNKVRKQWRLKKPEFTADNKLKITTLDDQIMIYCLKSENCSETEATGSNGDRKRSNGGGSIAGGNGGGPNPFERSDSENDPKFIKVNLNLLIF